MNPFTLLPLLFPSNCPFCQKPLTIGELSLCRHCDSHLPRTDFHLQPNNPAEQRFYGKQPVERCTCYCYYRKDERLQSLIHQFKYHDNRLLARQLAQKYATEILPSGWHHPIQAIIPVPLHPFKRMSRGYNQSEWIASGLADIWQIPLHSDLLIKERHTSSQTDKSIFERHLNTAHTFRLCKPEQLAGKHILLVDDVLTSGSTLEACIEALLLASNTKISILTLGFAE